MYTKRKKEEGRRKKEEKEEGRRKKEEGRSNKINGFSHSQRPNPFRPCYICKNLFSEVLGVK
jgi:hypothetical protein